jgi:hypothetical protein
MKITQGQLKKIIKEAISEAEDISIFWDNKHFMELKPNQTVKIYIHTQGEVSVPVDKFLMMASKIQ